MKVIYRIEKHFESFGRIERKRLVSFDKVENAIEFHKKKNKNCDFGTWFEIIVEYEGQRGV